MFRTLLLALAFTAALVGCKRNDRDGDDSSTASDDSNPAPAPAPAPDPASPAAPASDRVLLEWNQEALDAIKAGEPRPTVVARALFIVFCSTYDAWAMNDPHADAVTLPPSMRRLPAAVSERGTREAVCFAAWRALVLLFPAREPAFTARLRLQGFDPAAPTDPATPSGLGRAAAESVFASRSSDGSNAAANFADTSGYVAVNSANPADPNYPGGHAFDPNHWQPLRVPTGTVRDGDGNPVVDHADPASYRTQAFLTPHWGSVTPFALTSSSQFRPVPPPQFGSPATYTDALGRTSTSHESWVDQFDFVLALNGHLTDENKVIAEFWAGGPGSETPPGLWNRMAQDVCRRADASLASDIKIFFALNAALLDASISCWDAKRAYDFIRPISAIRHSHHGELVMGWAGPRGGSMMMPGEEWRPYQALTFVTPPFPEYTSGHSTFGGAWATVLRAFFGTETFYDGTTTVGADRNGDGSPDLLGQHVALPGSLAYETGPAEPVTLRWMTFTEAAEEAGMSRLYGGIHIMDANVRGREAGVSLGLQAYERAAAYWEGTAVP